MKEEIIITVKQLARQRGFSFTMAELAQQLNISTKTLYRHFSGKEEIIRCIILDMKEESDQLQMALIQNKEMDIVEKLKALLTSLPTDYDLINPININRIRRDYPELYSLVGTIYHKDWDRFTRVYEEGVNNKILAPMDIVLFKEMYIASITYLPEVRELAAYNHKQLLIQIVERLFAGIAVLP